MPLFLNEKYSPFRYIIICIISLVSSCLQAQDTIITTDKCSPKTLFDLFKKKDSTVEAKPAKNSFFLIIPVIGSQPATGFVFGGVAQYTFKGKEENAKYSIVNLGVTYTTKNQLLINMKNSVLLKNNRIFLNGDYRLYLFSQPNYGLGTSILPPNQDDFDIESIAQPMDYNYFKFHQTASWLVTENLYVGGGINIDWYSNIQDKQLDVAKSVFTHHYNYSQKYGFNDKEYFLNGASFNITYDSRDNQVNARSGWFANINYRINPEIFNSQDNSNVLYAEYRNFIPVSKKNDKYILAFWTYGQFVVRGKVPYLNLPAIGWDQRSRSGEGYTQGLFRGMSMVYLSTEFRFPITCNELLSGTVFSNFVTTNNQDNGTKLFQYIQPAVGVGLRILIDKATRTNLVADYAKGRDSKAFYLNAGETF